VFQEFNDIKNNIKDVVDPHQVKKEITSSWSDFWNFHLATDESGATVTLGIVIIALICFVIGIIISKYLSRKLIRVFSTRLHMAPSTVHIWNSLSFYILCLFTTLIALKIAHVPLTIFTLMGGAVALGVGFGSRNLVSNFMSGLIFMFEAPAKMGDFVEVEGYFGRVVEVGMRATHLEIGLHRRAIIPNSSFLDKTIVNWGRAGNPVNLKVDVNVEYGSDIAKAEKLLLQAPKGLKQIVDNLPCSVNVKSFADSGIVLELSFPVQIYNPGDRDAVASEVRKKIAALFEKEQIAIPFPQLVLHSTANGREKSPNLDPA
jgi:small-conductance mechanosensitive channel